MIDLKQQSCYNSAIPALECAVDDYKCQCAPAAQVSLSAALIPCVATACPPVSFAAVAASASAVCACAATATLDYAPTQPTLDLLGMQALINRNVQASFAPTTGGSMGGSMTSSAAAGSMTDNAGVVDSMVTVGSMVTSSSSACTPGPQTKDCGAVADAIPSCAVSTPDGYFPTGNN